MASLHNRRTVIKTILTDQFPSVNLPPLGGGNEYRNPHTDTMQRGRHLEMLISKWNFSVRFHPSVLQKSCLSGGRKSLGTRGDRGHQGNKAL